MTHPHDPYSEPTELEDAVGRLTDPLNDPLPSTERRGQEQGPGQGPRQRAGGAGSPWFRPHQQPAAERRYSGGYEPVHPSGRHLSPNPRTSPESYGVGADDPLTGRPHDPLSDPLGGGGAPGSYDPYTPYPRQGPHEPQSPHTAHDAHTSRAAAGTYETREAAEHRTDRVDPAEDQLAVDNETMALRQANKPSRRTSGTADEDSEPDKPTGSRMANKARRNGRGGRRGEGAEESAVGGRVARRKAAAKAAKQRRSDLGALASRAIGELFITTGMLLLLFVTYQLWWTNIQANQQANKEANNLERAFEEGDGKKPEAFEPGEGFAIMYIPKLDVRVPVAEGIAKGGVLDRGMAGHYDKKSGIETAMPWDKKGNFAVAGHRNTHGEPFRYINRLAKGDQIIVETSSTYYTYEVASWLPSTTPSNVDVVSPVPKESGFTKEGRYLTLTTCTPEFSSKYRLIVWGTMVDESPRDKGKPDALG